MMGIDQRMQSFFQMKQASGFGSQLSFINHPQHDKDDNEDEAKDEKYDDTTLRD